MNTKTLCVFYDTNCLPFKDSERTIHYPITGNAFMGASLTSEIRFYIDRIGGNDMDWVACSKLPNGKIGSKVLTTYYDSELEEYYALLPLSSFYTQYKGDLYISLQGYNGGIEVIEDEDTGIYTIKGTPVIQATGSIKLNIAYATQFVGSGEEENTTIQDILALIGTKLNKNDNKVIKSVNGIANINDGTYDSYFEGTTPFIDRQSGKMYLGIKLGNDIYYDPLYLDLRNVVEISDLSFIDLSQLDNLLQNKFACILYNGELYYKTNGSLPLVFKAISSTIAQEQDEYRIYEQFITIDTSDWVTITATTSTNGVSVYDTEQVDEKIASAISSVYKYKGSVATYNDLPSSDLTIGDVYNVEDTGDNYAWTGTTWDKLAGVVDLSNYVTISDLTSALANKQDKLVSGVNIKTINGQSILGSGDLPISGGGGTDYTAGYGIDIENDTISVDTDDIATKQFVNSSVATNTATFRGTYNVVSDLSLTTSATHQEIASAIATKLASLSIVADDNDYVFVSFPNATVSTDFDKYERYKFNGTSWEYEYTLNNSSFTAEQWAAINSGINSTILSNLATKTELNTKPNKWVGAYVGDETAFTTDMQVGDVVMEATGGQFLINEITFNGATLTKVVLVGLEDNGNPVTHIYENSEWASVNYVSVQLALKADKADIDYVVLKNHSNFGVVTGDEAYKIRNGGFIPNFAAFNGNQRSGIFIQLKHISGNIYKAGGWFFDTSNNLILYEGQVGGVAEGSTSGISYSNFTEIKLVDVKYATLSSSNIGTIATTAITTGWYRNGIAITSGLTNAVDVKVKMSNGAVYPAINNNGTELVIFSGTDFQTSGLTVTAVYYKNL